MLNEVGYLGEDAQAIRLKPAVQQYVRDRDRMEDNK